MPLEAELQMEQADIEKILRDSWEHVDHLDQFYITAATRLQEWYASASAPSVPVAWRWKYHDSEKWQHCSAEYTPPKGTIFEPLYVDSFHAYPVNAHKR